LSLLVRNWWQGSLTYSFQRLSWQTKLLIVSSLVVLIGLGFGVLFQNRLVSLARGYWYGNYSTKYGGRIGCYPNYSVSAFPDFGWYYFDGDCNVKNTSSKQQVYNHNYNPGYDTYHYRNYPNLPDYLNYPTASNYYSTNQSQSAGVNNPTPNTNYSSSKVLFYDHDQVGFCPTGYTELGGDRTLRLEYDHFWDTNNRSARMCILDIYQNQPSPYPATSLKDRKGNIVGPWTQVVVFLNYEQFPSCPVNYTQLGGDYLRLEYDYTWDTNNRSGRFCVRNDKVNDFLLFNAEKEWQNFCPAGYTYFGGSGVRIEYDYAQDTNNRSGRLCVAN
jgi:hypothetical protein